MVQWFWTVLNIAIAPNSPGGYGFIINVKSYGHIALTLFLGIGIFFMHTVRQNLGYDAKRTRTRVLIAGALLALISAALLIVSAMGRGYPSHWLWPVALAVVLSFFFIYWALFTLWLWRSKHSSPGTKSSTVTIYKYHPRLQTVEAGFQGRQLPRPVGSLATIRASDDINREKGAAQGNEFPSSVSSEDIRIREKLVYRWNMWGETRLIVYNWSDPTKKRIKRMYELLAMPQEINKPVPHAGWVRISSPSLDMGGYTMVRGRVPRGSVGTLRETPPGVGVGPSPWSSPASRPPQVVLQQNISAGGSQVQ